MQDFLKLINDSKNVIVNDVQCHIDIEGNAITVTSVNCDEYDFAINLSDLRVKKIKEHVYYMSDQVINDDSCNDIVTFI